MRGLIITPSSLFSYLSSSLPSLPKEWLFAPERGNVVFASSLYCWAFSILTFARIWMRKLGLKPGQLVRHLWGDFVLNVKTLAVSRYTPESKAKPMFVAMILDPIWQIYEATVLGKDLQKVGKMVKRLDLVSAFFGGKMEKGRRATLCRQDRIIYYILAYFLTFHISHL